MQRNHTKSTAFEFCKHAYDAWYCATVNFFSCKSRWRGSYVSYHKEITSPHGFTKVRNFCSLSISEAQKQRLFKNQSNPATVEYFPSILISLNSLILIDNGAIFVTESVLTCHYSILGINSSGIVQMAPQLAWRIYFIFAVCGKGREVTPNTFSGKCVTNVFGQLSQFFFRKSKMVKKKIRIISINLCHQW